MGMPRIYATNAERQRAYRERKRLKASPAKEVICAEHYLRKWPSGECFTFRFESAIVVISAPTNRNASAWLGCRVYELTRLWAPDGHGANLLTRAIAHTVRQFRLLGIGDALLSFADPAAGHRGGVYRAASWHCLGRSQRTYRMPGLSRGAVRKLPVAERKTGAAKTRFAYALTPEGKAAIYAKQGSLRG
jgi:hypothetical protein